MVTIMNIALCNRPETWPGGDMVQLRGYQKALQKLGHKADYLSHPIQSKSYDEAWIFHVNFYWALNHVKAAVKYNIPYRLFPIYYPELHEMINLSDIQYMFDHAIKVYYLSEAESLDVRQDNFSVPCARYKVIDNGVDTDIFYPFLRQPCGVVSVGRFLESKGLHHVIECCKTLGFPLEIIGFTSDIRYEDYCRELAEGSYTNISCNLSQKDMASIFSGCRVIVCASHSERNNLAILEGAACGVTPVDSIYNRAFPLHGFYVANPHDHKNLTEMIELAWNSPLDYSSHIKDWSDIVKDILNND